MSISETETKRVHIGAVGELPAGASRFVAVGERRIVVFNVEGNLYAIDDRCPHRGASLGKGTRDGFVVTCPLHKWEFDLRTGQRVGQTGIELRRFEVFQTGDSLLLDVSETDENTSAWDGIYRYLVRYGAMGWVGHFGSIDRIECTHGTSVIVQTSRGIEIGEILAGPDERADDSSDSTNPRPAGEVLRSLTADDNEHHHTPTADSPDVFGECCKLLSDHQVAVEVIDYERLFDGETLVIYFLGEESYELQSIAEKLAENWQLRVLFNSAVETAPAAGGGCGGGSCGSGGCSSGTA